MRIAGFEFDLLPDDDRPASVRRWRIKLAVVACSAWLAHVFVVLPALFVGLPLAGQVAWSNDTQRIDAVAQRAESTATSNTALIEKQIQVQATLSADVNDLMLAVISGRIRLAIAARCRLPASERARLTDEIENQQQLYVKRTNGVRAYEPRCNEL